MPDFYATSTNNAVEIDKDVYPYRDTELLKKLVSGANVSITSEDLDGITQVRDSAFYRCSNITSITIPNSVTAIGNSAFYACSYLTSISIPDSVTSIADYAFYSCSRVASVTIGSSVISIGNAAFSTTAVRSIIIPDSVTSIGDNAFSWCGSLANVAIGNSVVSVGATSFNGCARLTEITCKATNPPTIQSNTFQGVPATCVIKVPAQSVEAYKSATNWSTRANYIQAI